jgi:hypothetical protein
VFIVVLRNLHWFSVLVGKVVPKVVEGYFDFFFEDLVAL